MIEECNGVLGTKWTADDVLKIGADILKIERKFNENAGLTAAQDRVPNSCDRNPCRRIIPSLTFQTVRLIPCTVNCNLLSVRRAGRSALPDTFSGRNDRKQKRDSDASESEALCRPRCPGHRTEAGVPFEFELPDGSPLSELVLRLHLPETGIRVIFVNGRSRSTDYVLQDKDEVGIFRPSAEVELADIQVDLYLYGELASHASDASNYGFANTRFG